MKVCIKLARARCASCIRCGVTSAAADLEPTV